MEEVTLSRLEGSEGVNHGIYGNNIQAKGMTSTRALCWEYV